MYERSRGRAIIVAVKYRNRVILNPTTSRGVAAVPGSAVAPAAASDFAGQGSGLLTVGVCQSLFIIAPSWEFAWMLMTEEVSTTLTVVVRH